METWKPWAQRGQRYWVPLAENTQMDGKTGTLLRPHPEQYPVTLKHAVQNWGPRTSPKMPLAWGNTGSQSTAFELAREGERWFAERGGEVVRKIQETKAVMEAGFFFFFF